MARPDPAEILEAVGAIFAALATSGTVVVDPLFADSEDEREYIPLLLDVTGQPDGWVLFLGPEEEPTPMGTDGDIQYATIGATRILQVNPQRVGESSFRYFGRSIEEAKAAFRLAANRRYGLDTSAGDFDLQHKGMWAPVGYARLQMGQNKCHVGPMTLRYFVRDC